MNSTSYTNVSSGILNFSKKKKKVRDRAGFNSIQRLIRDWF